MPIYGYRCTECSHELEVLQSMSAEPLRVCSVCGGALRKLLYPVGVQFKGSGFYTTDYRNGGGAKSRSESGGTSDSTGSSGSSSSADSNGSSKTSEKKTESAASKE